MHVDFEDLVPLREALYGPDGLFPHIRRAEVSEKIGPVIKRKVWKHSRLRTEFLKRDDVAKARSQVVT